MQQLSSPDSAHREIIQLTPEKKNLRSTHKQKPLSPRPPGLETLSYFPPLAPYLKLLTQRLL